jgi:hypothetical protein
MPHRIAHVHPDFAVIPGRRHSALKTRVNALTGALRNVSPDIFQRSASRLLKNSLHGHSGARVSANPESRTSGFPAFLDSGFGPSGRPGMTAEGFSAAC